MHAAQLQALPTQQFYSIEYPGLVSRNSVSTAIETLGGQSSIDNVFARRKHSSDTRGNLLDLSFRPDNPFAHPVAGEDVPTNKFLLKIRRRRLRQVSIDSQDQRPKGEYTASILGTIPRSVRFRSMVDFQFQPDLTDPIAKLRMSMATFDAESIRDFKFEAEKEQYSTETVVDENATAERSNLNLIPPPIFSRQGIPQIYNFKQNPMSTVETSLDVITGLEKKRYINRFRWKGWSVVSASITDQELPSKPSKQVEDMRSSANEGLYSRLQELFQQRPIWTKLALLNQFSETEAREINNTKYLIPLVCFVFIDGPWRDTLVRFDYDPRKNKTARFYQRIYFRNLNNPMTRPSVSVRPESKHIESLQEQVTSDRSSHIFDGKVRHSETASFQFCDIVDPLLKGMITSSEAASDTYDDRYGWYLQTQLENIKIILRHKFFSLLEGHIPTDAECQKLLDAKQESGSSKSTFTYRRVRKHNKAKGALPPEEQAVSE